MELINTTFKWRQHCELPLSYHVRTRTDPRIIILGLFASAYETRRKSSVPKGKCTDDLVTIIEDKLLATWSPEQISNTVTLGLASFKTIYNWLYSGKLTNTSVTVLRQKGKRRKAEKRGKFSMGTRQYGSQPWRELGLLCHICLVNEMLCKIAGICVEGVTICHPLVLSVVFLPPISGIFRPGKLIGGLADFLHFLSRSALSSIAI